MSVAADNGKVTEFVYQNQRLVKVTAYHQNQPGTILAELEYTYHSDGLLAAMTLRQSGGNVLRPAERVLYSYYTDEDICGNTGDLKTVVIETANNDSWIPAQTYCYRYYKEGEVHGPKHAMKMAFFPADFELFSQKTGNTCSVPDAEALDYATKYYEYDAQQRVILERVDRNRKLITLAYTEYPDTNDRNAVHRKTVETGPFGEQNIVFTNSHGQVLLREEIAPPGTEEPSVIYHFRYNGAGKRTHRYSAGVVLGYTIVSGQPTALALDLAPDKGIIEISQYRGNWCGAEAMSFRKTLQNGTKGIPIVQEEIQYENHNVNGKPNWRIKQNTRFTDEEAKSAIATSYQYELFPGTDKVLQKTTALPAIPKEQNGTGFAGTMVERFDEKGRLIWSKDVLGIIEYNQFDPKSGQLVKTIRDVDMAKTADFGEKIPQGWATIADAGKHLVTEYEYDVQGRMTQVLSPENESVDENNNVIMARRASWTVYDDARRRTMSASGYVTADHKAVLVNPVSITIRGIGGKVLEEITAARDKAEGRLLAADKFPQSSYVSWTKHFYEGRNKVATRVYTTIPLTGDGVQGKNYEETVFLRDEFGRQNRTVAPNGLITKQKQNWRGYAVEVWQGDDESNLVLMTEMVYGGEGACPTCSGRGSNPRVVIRHVDDEKMRITENVYDWRGRLIETFGEEDANGQFVSTKSHYDNLGRVVKTEQFVNDSLEKRLVACSESLYTPQGNVWCQRSTAVDPKTGEMVETQKSLTWFDTAGRGFKSQSACQCITNVSTYDSLGRTVKSVVLGKNGEVLQETEQVYDSAGNVIQTISTERSATSKKKFSRKQFSASWFDPMGRSIASANYGTNGGKELNRPTVVPARSDDVLVTETRYDTATGRAFRTIDPAGKTHLTFVDARGRTVKTVANYTNGAVAAHTPDENVTVEMTYAPSGKVATLTAKNPTTGDHVTTYEYDAFGRLFREFYPDSQNSLDDCVEFGYNRAGEVLTKKDQNGTIHAYEYDNLGRRLHDRITTLGDSVDGLVRRISTMYNVLGQVESVASYDVSNNVLNEVKYEYDENQKLMRLYQSHGRAVDVSKTPYVEYGYGGVADAFRLKTMKYPSGKTLTYDYDAHGNVITINEGTKPLVSYQRSGGGTIMQTTYNKPGLTLNYENGLDRFGRIIDHAWQKDSKDVVRIQHGYDRVGNRIYRNDVVHVANSEVYTYDGANQIKSLQRESHSEAWNYDSTGNWLQHKRNGDIEHRTHNAANEIQTACTHDKNGNMTLMPSLKGKYDAWNRLVQVGNSIRYEYNGLNQRVKKTVSGVTTTSFFNSQWQELESTEPQSSDCVYIWGLRYIDDLVLRERGSEKLYSLADPNWNVVAIVNASGTVQERMRYDAFGKVTWLDSDFAVKPKSEYTWNRTFTGQVFDTETGLMLYRNRFYHAGLGRFVTRDPIGYDAGDENLYRYVENSPAFSLDPNGFEKQHTIRLYHNAFKYPQHLSADNIALITTEINRIYADCIQDCACDTTNTLTVSWLHTTKPQEEIDLGYTKYTLSYFIGDQLTLRTGVASNSPLVLGQGGGWGISINPIAINRHKEVNPNPNAPEDPAAPSTPEEITKFTIAAAAVIAHEVQEATFSIVHAYHGGYIDSKIGNISGSGKLSPGGCRKLLWKMGIKPRYLKCLSFQ